jgi:uncharacterized protein YjbI with pentapeptide repeats
VRQANAGLVAVALSVAILLVLAVGILPPVLAGEGEAENNVRSTLLQGLAGLVLAGGLYFTAQTLRLNRESAERASESAARTYELEREGQITERFTRAIDQLGNKELDVRLGGIYALERIAKGSADDRGPIMEVLTAYVREHAPWPPRPTKEAEEEAEEAGSAEHRAPHDDEDARINTDVQAVIAVLGRREPSGRQEHRLDLSSADLKGARFAEAPDEGHFERAIFSRTRLENATLHRVILTGADLTGADLTGADLTGATLADADLQGADLTGANLEGADLTGANLEAAHLKEANLAGAKLPGALLAGVHLPGARLRWADLAQANLAGAGLRGANLAGANLPGADFEEADLAEASLASANLEGANLEGANLEGANLLGANFTKADLEYTDLTDAVYDSETTWPADFDPKAQGAQPLGGNSELASDG